MKKFDRVKAVVSLDAIAHNFEEMKKKYRRRNKDRCCYQGRRLWTRRGSNCASDRRL